jgi:hypothetical protein
MEACKLEFDGEVRTPLCTRNYFVVWYDYSSFSAVEPMIGIQYSLLCNTAHLICRVKIPSSFYEKLPPAGVYDGKSLFLRQRCDR